MVNSFSQKELGHHCTYDKSERGRRRGHQAEVAPGKRRQKAEKSHGKTAQGKKKMFLAEDGPDHCRQAPARAQLIQVADPFHRAGEQDVPATGGQHHKGNRHPQLKRFHAAPSAPPQRSRAGAWLIPGLGLPSLRRRSSTFLPASATWRRSREKQTSRSGSPARSPVQSPARHNSSRQTKARSGTKQKTC